jgi:hypothetical protein
MPARAKRSRRGSLPAVVVAGRLPDVLEDRTSLGVDGDFWVMWWLSTSNE